MHEEQIVVKKGSFGSMVSGFLIGGLIGAAVALLSAPQSGVETREMLREKTGELRGKAMDAAEQTRHRAEKVISSARGRAEDIAQTAREKTKDVLHQGSEQLEETSRRMDDIANRTGSAGM